MDYLGAHPQYVFLYDYDLVYSVSVHSIDLAKLVTRRSERDVISYCNHAPSCLTLSMYTFSSPFSFGLISAQNLLQLSSEILLLGQT